MISPRTHAITEFPIAYTGTGPAGITTGPDGNIWFVDSGTNAVGVVTLARTQLVVTEPLPSSLTAGIPFPLMVEAEDSSGNLDTSFNGAVAVSLENNPGGATLGGTLTATANGGVATFSDLTLTAAASGYTLQVSGSGVGAVTTSTLDVTPAAASQLMIQTQPSGTATAGQAFATQPVIEEMDQFGNLETGDNSTVFTAALDSGIGPLQGTKTATVVGGVATFTDLADNKAETLSLEFNGGGLTSAPTGSIVVSPAAASQLVIAQQPSAKATAGQPFEIQPVVSEEDAFGNLETGDNATVVTAGLSSGAGPLQGMTATLSGGVASFTGLADKKAETLSLKYTGGGLTSSPTSSITVNPAAASQLVIQTQPSATATAGQAFAIQPVVYEEDPFGNVETGDNSTVVAASLSSGAGPLRGTTTATLVDGVATFAGLTDNKAETVTLKFTSGSLTASVSGSIVVSPATASQLAIHSQPSATATAGQAFAIQPVIYEEDQYGNVETGDSSTVVTAALSSGIGPLQGTARATVVGGAATFAGLVDNKAESIALQFTSGSLSPASSSVIVVNPAAASQLMIHIQPSATATAGHLFATQPVLYEEDKFGNLETGDISTVVTAALSSGAGPLQGTVTTTVSGGVATFTGLADNKAETLSLEFAGGGLTSAATGAIVVSPAAPSQLIIHTQPSATTLVRQAFARQPVVYEEDQFGNLETSDNGTVVTASLKSGAGPLQGTTAATVVGGMATFSGLANDSSETITLRFASGSLTPAASNPVVVNPAVDLAVSSFAAAPGTVEVGANLTYTIVVTNSGPSPATAVTVTSPLGSDVSYVDGSGTVSLRGSNVVASLGTLEQGASATVTFTVVLNSIGTLSASASVASNETDTNPSNNSASISTAVVDRVGTVAFGAGGYAVPENAGSATITVNRVSGARGTVMVDYRTVPVNAIAGLDFTQVSGTLTFGSGVTSQTIVIPVLVNPYDHREELVSVVLSNVRTTETLGNAILGTPAAATLTIQDIDPNNIPLSVTAVQWTGSAQGITQLFVTFNRPLIASTAINPANYSLVNIGPDGKYGTHDDSSVSMSVAMYQSSNQIVALTPAQPLRVNQFFQLSINGDSAAGLEDIGDNRLAGDGVTPGTSYTAMLARGASLKYYTPADDQVSLKITGGGIIDDLLSGSGQGIKLSVVGEVPHRTVLSGSIRKARGGTGKAYLGYTIWGLGNFGDVRVKMSSPPFQISQYPFSPGSVASTAVRPLIFSSVVGAKRSARLTLEPKPASRGPLSSVASTMNRPFHRFWR
jgi:uncharacterized repeat protein (TIGR01451 family)